MWFKNAQIYRLPANWDMTAGRLDVVRDQIDDPEDAEALFDAEFALMTGELSRLIPSVVAALGGEFVQRGQQ